MTDKPASDVFPALTSAPVTEIAVLSLVLSNQSDLYNLCCEGNAISFHSKIDYRQYRLRMRFIRPSISAVLLVTYAGYKFETPENNLVTNERSMGTYYTYICRVKVELCWLTFISFGLPSSLA